MEATTPIGSRRTIEVWPSMYSPATGPCMLRTAPAKKRKQSATAGTSSLRTSLIGLPQFSASSCAKSSSRASIASASASSRPERWPGVVRAQAGKAARAAATARLT